MIHITKIYQNEKYKVRIPIVGPSAFLDRPKNVVPSFRRKASNMKQ